ncbi:LSU ribosomal protein L7AE [Caloranaerobacter azorensis DSM 13643]|uniref:LSU ribosomal protein L7AE n=3 Tax=Caloranaerobacter azorensis TaxID=116090 RepID=A0A1M5VMN2_9FIRM|nr:ribosomal L7Ae/L30e/S12e/Gadd45 family protein [Caloranaerobacter azorensis]SHH76485.1 LSU ribosomal protein L7AE [Caloranaerobacter azorensis DSM 13643]
MMLSMLKDAKKVVGTKQAKRAVINDKAKIVFVAKDADRHVVDDLIKMCEEKSIEIVYVDSMKELGSACGIELKAASAAILKE